MPGDSLDLSSDPPSRSNSDSQPNGASARRFGDDAAAGTSHSARRRFVGVHFVCCDVYSRIYINREQTGYVGHCPRCSRRIELKIGPGGTDSRFFTAY